MFLKEHWMEHWDCFGWGSDNVKQTDRYLLIFIAAHSKRVCHWDIKHYSLTYFYEDGQDIMTLIQTPTLHKSKFHTLMWFLTTLVLCSLWSSGIPISSQMSFRRHKALFRHDTDSAASTSLYGQMRRCSGPSQIQSHRSS